MHNVLYRGNRCFRREHSDVASRSRHETIDVQ